MKKSCSTLGILIIVILGTVYAYSQIVSGLSQLSDSVVVAVQAKKPNWKYHAVSPIDGSADLILQQWTLDSQSLRIAIIPHPSAADASRVMRALATNSRGRQDNEGLGDEAVSWGKNTISFRRRNFTVDISVVTISPTLSATESSDREADERKLCKEFARIVAEAIKDSR
ncbi:MAG TPA: hypothetical protein DC047_01605 [Blastocatellia bacterium]|nr:hypothetical protein [Blastocatellia bacterium]